MIVKKLELVNFQVIRELSADFEGNVYFITGDNELGKSTVLKAIGTLLTGCRDDVLRKGEKKGFAKMVVGDDGEEYNVELRFTEANPRGTLTIKQKSTGKQSNNISMLQKIFGYVDFDAVEFSRWSETAEGRRKQIAVVKALLPEKVQAKIAEYDESISTMKAQRTDVHRELKTYKTIYEESAKGLSEQDFEDYAEPIDISDLLTEQAENARLIEKAKKVREIHEQRAAQLAEIPTRLRAVEEHKDQELQRLDDAIAKAKEEYEQKIYGLECDKTAVMDESEQRYDEILAEEKDLQQRKANAETWLAKYEENNPERIDIAEQLSNANKHNAINAHVNDCKAKKDKYLEVYYKFDELDAYVCKYEDMRAELIANANLPIKGLSFTEDGLELNGIPFVPGKVSDSQIMEVAAQLIIASNPKINVFRIARGESLGAKRLQAIIDIARKHGFQGFVEEVHRGQDELVIEEYTEK